MIFTTKPPVILSIAAGCKLIPLLVSIIWFIRDGKSDNRRNRRLLIRTSIWERIINRMLAEDVYIEKDCTVEFEGKKFTEGGAFVSPVYAIGYLKFDREYLYATGKVTTWHGEYLGEAQIVARWKVKSYMADEMMQVICIINGVKYTGRSFGNGMIWKGKRCKHQ
jgi:hypothetical protein